MPDLIEKGDMKNLLPDAVSGTVTGDWFTFGADTAKKSIEIDIETTATVIIEVTNGEGVVTELTPSGGQTTSIGREHGYPWHKIRARVSAWTAGDVDVYVRS